MMKMKMGETKKGVAEEPHELGEERINYQEYVVPAFLTQVGLDELGADNLEDGEAIATCSSAGDLLPGDGPHKRIFHRRTSPGI